MLLKISLLLLGVWLHQSDALAVMSVDLGSQFMKVAIVKPGVPMEIALNKETRRKTPVVMSMRNGERSLGDDALHTAVKYPRLAYWFLQSLLGKDMDSPQVRDFQKRFPYYNLERDYETGMPIFVHDDGVSGAKFTVEELFAMILENAKQTAEAFAEQPISEAVITVPPFFSQAERRAMLRAGELAGLTVLQLMNDNAAVALNFAVFRSKSFNKTASYYMFFDVGASSTTATVVAFQIAESKNPVTGIKESHPQVTVKGVGFDRTLGGVEFQLRLRDHLARLFDKSKKTKSDLFSNERAMSKLFKEAGRLMHVLSANTRSVFQVEGLLDDEDFKTTVTRAEFEEMCSDLFARVAKPVQDAIKSSQVTWEEINEVILMGGGTRIPKIQSILQKTIGRNELGKSINTDEAAALGAVYQAAHLSKGFKVKKHIVKDANLYPIQVEFERARKEGDESTDETKKMVKRTLFGFMNPFPQKKVMTFNKHVSDFTFEVNYADQEQLSADQMQFFGSKQLQRIMLTGITEAYARHAADGAESKGVKAHFRVDDSGLLQFDKAESIFEHSAEAAAAEEEESTLSKLGSFFFGGGDKDKEKEGEKEKTEQAPGEEKEKEGESEKKEGDETPKDDAQKSEEGEKSAEKEPEKPAKEKEPEASEAEVPQQDLGSEKSETQNEPKKPETPETDSEAGSEAKEPEKVKETDEQEQKTENQSEGNEEGKPEEEQKEEQKTEEGTKEEKSEKKEDEKEEKKEEAKEVKKEVKPKTVKEALKSQIKLVDITDPTIEQIRASKKLMKDLKKKDEEKELLAKATNDLESFIIDAQDKLWQDDYEHCSTEEEREELRGNLSAASDWLYEQEPTTEKKAFEDKLAELKRQTRKLWDRVVEYQERPKAIETLNSILNYSDHFLVSMLNYTGGDDKPFTEVEYTTLEKLINDTKEWNVTLSKEQEDVPPTVKPKMTVADIAGKINELDREVKYLISKAKYFRPKNKTSESKKSSNKTKSALNDTDTSEKDADVEADAKETMEEKEEEWKPVADGATDGDEPEATPTPSADGDDEPVPLDIPPMPGSEEELEQRKKDRQKKKEGEGTEDGEETLQLDAADSDVPTPTDTPEAESTTQDADSTTKHGHDDL